MNANQTQIPVIQTSDANLQQIQQNANKVLRNLNEQIIQNTNAIDTLQVEFDAFVPATYPVSIANGGTGEVTANAALNALLPNQSGNSGKVLETDGTNSSWVPVATVSTGNLTDVGTDGIVITGGTNAVVGSGTSIAQHVADSSHNGYLSSTDWSTFNAKQAALTIGNLTDVGTDGITVTGGTGSVIGSGTSIAQHVADASHNGYLSSVDWTTFNAKQSSLAIGNLTDTGTDGITVTGGTGAVIGSGTSLSQHVADASHNGYLSSTDWSTFNAKQASGSYITALTGDVTAAGPGSVAATIASNAVTNAKAAQMAANTIKGNNTGSTANAADLTVSQAQTLLSINDVLGYIPQYPYFYDEFFGQSTNGTAINTTLWGAYTAGGALSPVFNDNTVNDGHPGVIKIQTANGGTSGSFYAVFTEQRQTVFNASTGYHDVEWLARVLTAPAVGDDYVVAIGFLEQSQYSTQDFGAMFLINRTNGTTNAATHFQCATMNGNNTSSATFVDSGVVFNNSWHKFRIIVNQTSGHAIFYLDGVQVADISTNVPTSAAGHGTAIGALIDNNGNAGTTGHFLYLDYCRFLNVLTASR